MRSLGIFALVALSACGSLPELEELPMSEHATRTHDLYAAKERQYLSCDHLSWNVGNNGETYGADPQYRRDWASSMHAQDAGTVAAIKQDNVYALLSSNVYRDPKDAYFQLPNWASAHRYASSTGLAFEEWHRTENGKLSEIAIVFRGTDDLRDLATSLAVWREPKQYAQAQQYVAALLAKPEYTGIPISVAGHSLGGGIALNVSLRQSTKDRPISAYAFNMSPRAFFGPYDGQPATRIIINERAEGLAALRQLWRRKIGPIEPYPVNFLDFRFYTQPVSEHSMYRLSRGLLLVAIGKGDGYALDVFRANVSMEQVATMKGSEWDARTGSDYKACSALLGPVPQAALPKR